MYCKNKEDVDEQSNRVVHSSHFLAIFASFSVFIFLPFFKNQIQSESKMIWKMIILWLIFTSHFQTSSFGLSNSAQCSVLSLYHNAHLPPWVIRKVPQPKPSMDQAPNRPKSHHWKLLSLLLLMIQMMRTLASKQPRCTIPPGHQLELTGLTGTLQTVKSSSPTQPRMIRMRVDKNTFQRAQNLNFTKWLQLLSSLQMLMPLSELTLL